MESLKRYKHVQLHFYSYPVKNIHGSNKPPVIFIHGLFASNSTWSRVINKIGNKTGRKVYSVDMRNHGMSEHSEEFSIPHMTADLQQWMQEQSINRAVLIGHSMGGRIAMELALQKPGLVEKLVVEDVLIKRDPDEVRLGLINLLKIVHDFFFHLPPCMEEAEVRKSLLNLFNESSMQLTATEKELKEVFGLLPFYKDKKTGEFKLYLNVLPIVDALEQPTKMSLNLKDDPVYNGETLFIYGEHSFLNVPDSVSVYNYFPQSEIQVLKRGRHVSHAESPDQFIQKVSDFINF